MEDKEDIMAVARAFMRSRIILSAAELDLFTSIQDSVTSAEKMAERLGLDRRALERVLDCLVTFGLLNKDGGAYSLPGRALYIHRNTPRPGFQCCCT